MGRRAAKDATAAFGGAAKDATALGGEVQSLVPTSSDSMHDGSKQSIGGFFRRIPRKTWLLMGLSVAGIVFVRSGGNKEIGKLIAKGRKRFHRRVHPSICTHLELRPAAFNMEDPLKKRKFCAQDM